MRHTPREQLLRVFTDPRGGRDMSRKAGGSEYHLFPSKTIAGGNSPLKIMVMLPSDGEAEKVSHL